MKYDVIIVGGGTAGCSCAYNSAKLGLKVLLIEKNSFLGGTMTSSLVTPAMKSETNNNINYDFYNYLMKKLYSIGGQTTYSDGNMGWFNPELMKIVLDEIMEEVGVTVLFNTKVNEVIRDKTKILAITLNYNYTKYLKYIETKYTDNIIESKKMLSEYIETKYLVDSTGDAKIFEKLNLKFLNQIEDNYQPTSLRFIMSGINLKDFSDWIMSVDSDRNVTTSCMIDGQIHLSTAYTWDKKQGKPWALDYLFNEGVEEGLLKLTDCNYFQLFTIPGMHSSVAFNCPRIPEEFNPSDKMAYSNALMRGRASILRLSKFLKAKFKGFENSYISSIANSLGIRVSNRITGKYIYTIDDLKSGKVFDYPVLISSYPVDVHSSEKDKSILKKCDIEYMLPVESLISKDYDNLFAIGRCISADFYAQAALRIIPSCFSMGEGLAKYLSKLENTEK